GEHRDPALKLIEGGGHQAGEEPGRAVPAVERGGAPDVVRAAFGERRAAAAVHVHVDEPGQRPPDPAGRGRRRLALPHRLDAAAGDPQPAGGQAAARRDHAVGGDYERLGIDHGPDTSAVGDRAQSDTVPSEPSRPARAWARAACIAPSSTGSPGTDVETIVGRARQSLGTSAATRAASSAPPALPTVPPRTTRPGSRTTQTAATPIETRCASSSMNAAPLPPGAMARSASAAVTASAAVGRWNPCSAASVCTARPPASACRPALLGCSFPAGSGAPCTGIQPISPAAPPTPRRTWPLMTAARPRPVPSHTNAKSSSP